MNLLDENFPEDQLPVLKHWRIRVRRIGAGAPGKITLYVGKAAVKFNIPEAEAVDRLVDLIKEHGKWTEPEASA